MPGHWSERYVGMAYVEGENDCGRFLARVTREVFGRNPPELPTVQNYDHNRDLSAQIRDGFEAYGERTDSPQEGDGVLLTCRAMTTHIGVYCVIGGVPHCLHAVRGAGCVVLHRMIDLPKYNMTVEGVYRWKTS